MFARLRSRDDTGFTLIELLVVIIIIGILAAIAIPVFLNQRKKGYDSAAKSDLRNLAEFQEVYLSSAQTYGPIASIQAAEPRLSVSSGVTLSVVTWDAAKGYCLSATHVSSGHTFYYDSLGGGLQPATAMGCPVSTSGVPGDSETG